jgi:hypothetical protein
LKSALQGFAEAYRNISVDCDAVRGAWLCSMEENSVAILRIPASYGITVLTVGRVPS